MIAPVVPLRTDTYDAQINFKVPRGLAAASPMPRSTRLDLRALSPLPGDV